MITIAPTILTADPNTFIAQSKLFPQFAKRIQLDIVDGNFAPTRTIALSQLPSLPNPDIQWDLHMMVSSPSAHIEDIIRLKPHLCIFPAEVNERLQPLFEQLKQAGIKTGIALLKPTFPGNLTNLIKEVDHVLIFAGNLGKQGGIANLIQIEKAPIIREINPNIEIGWDGGANLKTIRTIAHAGIDVVNVGSAISSAPDPAQAYKDLNAEADRPGIRI